MTIAKKATLENTNVKCLIWGVQGSGKSRFALSAPSPIVLDYEGSTRLYANDFDFLRAEVKTGDPQIGDPVGLTREVVRELVKGLYPDVKTLVVDPLTDLLETLEKQTADDYEKLIGKKVQELNALQKTKWYAFRRDYARRLLDALKNLPLNLILVARAKEIWDNGKPSGKFAPDINPVVMYLMDIVIELQKTKHNEYKAIVSKSRLANLPDVLPVKNYSSVLNAIEELKNKGSGQPIETQATEPQLNKTELYETIETLTGQQYYNHANHERNSLIKHLEVESLRNCQDVQKLYKYYQHIIQNLSEEISTEPAKVTFRSLCEQKNFSGALAFYKGAIEEKQAEYTVEQLDDMMKVVEEKAPDKLDDFVNAADSKLYAVCQRIYEEAQKEV